MHTAQAALLKCGGIYVGPGQFHLIAAHTHYISGLFTVRVCPCLGNMQSAVDEKKKLELRVDNITGELNKAKSHVTELEGGRQQLQVRVASSLS